MKTWPKSKWTLLLYSLLLRLLLILFLVLASYLPAFDASPALLIPGKELLPLLRWDAFHFTHIAMKGYVFEHQWAFFPGVPLVLQLLHRFVSLTASPLQSVLLNGALMATCSLRTVVTLYDLTYHYTSSSDMSYLATFLSIFSPSPVIFGLASYSEPLFALFSYEGMLLCTKQRWSLASICFMVSVLFRANGILLVIFLLWGMLVEPYLTARKVSLTCIIKCVVYMSLVLVPFVAHQYSGWLAFCQSPDAYAQHPWCTSSLPLIYGHAQSKYWGVGPFKYWTLAQLPNFLLPLPLIMLVIFSSSVFIFQHYSHLLFLSFQSSQSREATSNKSFNRLYHKSMVPHAAYALLLVTWISVGAHIQILLRLATSLPFMYWSAASLLVQKPERGKLWVYWSVTWGALSVILWAAYLPPA